LFKFEIHKISAASRNL